MTAKRQRGRKWAMLEAVATAMLHGWELSYLTGRALELGWELSTNRMAAPAAVMHRRGVYILVGPDRVLVVK